MSCYMFYYCEKTTPNTHMKWYEKQHIRIALLLMFPKPRNEWKVH